MEKPLQRIFLSIDPIPWKDMLNHWQIFLQQKLHTTDAKCSWLKKTSLHVTLLFLGELPLTVVMQLKNALHQFTFKEEIQLKIREIGLLNKYHIVAYLENDNLTHLHRALLDYVELLGIPIKKEHAFMPHITLGKIRDLEIEETVLRYFKQINTRPLQAVKIQKMALYQSFTGNHYEILQQYSL